MAHLRCGSQYDLQKRFSETITHDVHKMRIGATRRTLNVKCQQRLSTSTVCQTHHTSRRGLSWVLITAGVALQLASSETALALSCPGLRGYALQQCLKEERKKREQEDSSVSDGERQQLKYEQPGELVTLPSGLQYREISVGEGPEALIGSECDILYTVYRLSSGGYYKYSSGGTPVFLWSLGYGNWEGRDDIGETYRFRLGDPDALPKAVAAAMVGMRVGGRRRVLIPPGGWDSEQTGPRPPTFGASRRWAAHKDEALLFEAQLVRVRSSSEASVQEVEELTKLQQQQGMPFRLPAPPSPYKQQLAPQPQQ